MKSLNENWFPITLITVVFGLIGYLIGTNSSKHHCPMMGDMDNHKIFMKKMNTKTCLMKFLIGLKEK